MEKLSTNVSKLDSSMPGYSMYKAECHCSADHHSQTITVDYDRDGDWTDIVIYHKAYTKRLESESNLFRNWYYKAENPVACWIARQGYSVCDLFVRVKFALKIVFTGFIEFEHYYTMRSSEHHNSYITALQDGLAEAERYRAEVKAEKEAKAKAQQ